MWLHFLFVSFRKLESVFKTHFCKLCTFESCTSTFLSLPISGGEVFDPSVISRALSCVSLRMHVSYETHVHPTMPGASKSAIWQNPTKNGRESSGDGGEPSAR